MATMSIFPPAPPRVPRISMPNPSNRKPSLKTVGQVEDGKSPIMISVAETPQDYTPKTFVHSPTFDAQAVTASPLFKNGIPPPPPPLPRSTSGAQNTATKPSGSNHSSPDPESIASSDTLVQYTPREEPVVAIKSMFPVYNPNVPINQRGYAPPRPTSTYDPRQYMSATSPSSVYSHAAVTTRPSYIPRANQDSIVEVPLDVLTFQEQTFSAPKELDRLWNATSSSEPIPAPASFDLEMGRLEEATFTFGSTADNPFYAVTTFDTAEISVTKTCPRKTTITCDVALASVEGTSRRLPPNDGLIATIFPKTAAMLAMTQTDALTEEYDLPSEDHKELLEAAMKRANDQEASYVRWNAIESRYELEHPAVSRKNRDTNFVTSPLSPQGASKPTIHITVVTSDELSTDQPIVLVTCPASARAATASESGAQTTQSTGDVQLASLDFNTNTLHIEANNIIEVMPSLFAVDSIFTAIAIVSVADENTNTAMGNMKTYTPKPAATKRNSTFNSPVASPTNGAFFATIAERAEAEEEARAAEKNHKKDKKNKAKTSKMVNIKEEEVDLEAGRSWYGKSKAKKPKKTKQIVISEFDLEKLNHYQSGSRQGQELPAITRGLLSTLFLCWLMVAVTRGVTSEKF